MTDQYYKETRGYFNNKRPPAVGEIEKLETEVDRFALDMKERLKKKVKKGYHGWDDNSNFDIIRNKLAYNMQSAMNEVDKNGYTKKARKEFTDIANLAMFLARFCK